MDDPWDISTQLAARRRELGWSLVQLARRADTSPATLSRYEKGWNRFEVYTLRKLATALGCRLVVKLEPQEAPSERVRTSAVVERLGRLFWDQELTARHLQEHPLWVIGRVLEFGNLEDVRMLIRLMGRETFLAHVCRARFESEKTRVFWQNILEREGMACTKRFFRREAASFWRSSRA